MDYGRESYAADQLHPHPAPPQTTAAATARIASALSSLFPSLSSSTAPDGTIAFVVGITNVVPAGDDDTGAYDAGYRNGGFGAVPASGEAITSLPKSTVGESEEGEKAECAVCLEGFETGEALRTMPCSHGFHESCISDWLRVSRLCPLCRFKMPAETGESDAAEEEEEGEQDDDDPASTC